MSDGDEQFQQRWGFRRNDSDLDSSSDDHSRPISVTETKLKKHKLATHPPINEDHQQTVHSPQSHPGVRNRLSYEEPSRSRKKQERKAKTSKANINYPEPSDTALTELREYMTSLVEGVKVTREDLLKWMKTEMEMSLKDEMTSKPTGTRKGQRRGSKETENKKRSKTPRSNPMKARRRSGTTSQNREDGSSEKSAKDSKPFHETSEVVVPEKEPAKNIGVIAMPADKNQKQKGKRLRLSSAKKQKVAASDEQTDKEHAPASVGVNVSASASDYLTLPTLLPRQEAESSERTNSEGGDDRDIIKITALDQASNLSSQVNFTPIYQKDGVFAQNGLWNATDYEPNTLQTTGNIRGAGNGNRFAFGFSSQGLNDGYGMSNSPSQFGLQYMSQESMLSGLRMNDGHPIMPTGNQAFMESYGSYNQQLRFRAQGGVMPLHSPDNIIRAGNLQPR